jgi:MSHA biogenesis protein MshM
VYEEYFGLERPPFKISPDTSLFYEGGKRGDILGALVYAIHRGEGIVKVVGEVGSGKTMLCRMLQLKLPKSVEIIYIANPSVSAEDILFVIAHELELPAAKDASKHEVVNMLQDYLLQRHIENKQVVLFIEEAQGMPLDTLEEIRLLSNLETDQHKLLQIILFGQPELDENLAKKSIRQLRERITHNFDLSPLTPAEIYSYMNFRMREVGYTGPELITGKLAKKVAQYSGGLLRRINIIADKLLLSAFAEGTHNLTSRHVIAAVNDSAFGDDVVTKNSNMMWWLVVPILIALALAVYSNGPLLNDVLANLSVKSPELVEKQVVDDNIPAEIEKPVTENGEKREDTGAKVTETAPVEMAVVVDTVIVDDEMVAAGKKPEQVVPESNVVELVETNSQFDEEEVEETPTISNSAEVVVGEQKTDLKQASNDTSMKYHQWLDAKLQQSREWLSKAKKDGVSIQVMMSIKAKERELVDYLRNDWPLNLDKTYLYEINIDSRNIYRVFYSEFESVAQGREEMERLPESLKVNSPYLHSVYRMQKALL